MPKRMMRKRLIAAIGTICLLAGCTMGQNYHRPAITSPVAFRGGGDVPAADPASLADLKWFEVFNDERLQEMIRTALVQSYDIRDAVVRVEAARANLGITRADQFPTIEAGAGVTSGRTSASGSVRLPEDVERTRTFGVVGLNLVSFEVDVWGRLRRATEAARADLLASDHNRKAVMTTLVSDVAGAYFNLLGLDAELAIAKRTLAVREKSLQLIRSRDRGGLGTLLEVRQGEQLVHGAARVIPAVEQLIEQTENQISFLLGYWPGNDSTWPRIEPAGRATICPCRTPFVAVGPTPRYQRGRAEPRRGQRRNRCRQGRVLPPDHPDRRSRVSERSIVKSLRRSRENLAVRAPGNAADLQCRSNSFDRGPRRSAEGTCAHSV